MGFAKNHMMELEERGYGDVPDKYICDECIQEQAEGDYALVTLVKENAEHDYCDYCRETFEEDKAVPLGVVVERVVEAFRLHYGFAVEELPYESAEGGYIGDTYDTYDLLSQYFPFNLELFKDLHSTIYENTWCDSDPFALSTDGMLMYSWERFSELVKHKKRFMFFEHNTDLSGDYYLSPKDILEEIGKVIQRLGLFRTIDTLEDLFRIRFGVGYTTVKELVSPPAEHAVHPNRMNPPGISMFYAAYDHATALLETASPADHGKDYVLAVFRLKAPLEIVDLTELPGQPSIFDIENIDDFFAVPFLKKYTMEISKEVDKQVGYSHIDYVPTQILTEYLRYGLKQNDSVGGFQFRSSKSSDGLNRSSLVLFLDHEEAQEALDLIGIREEKCQYVIVLPNP